MSTNRQRSLYLASQSPRRAHILEELSIPFKTITNACDDEPKINNNELPLDYVQRVANTKCLASCNGVDDGLVLASDTIIEFDGNVLGKPSSLEAAKHTLLQLSGQSHQVHSAISIMDIESNQHHQDVDTTPVTFHHLTETIIDHYIANHTVLDKAGSYGIQDVPDFIAQIEGDYWNVVGLPVTCLLNILQSYDIV